METHTASEQPCVVFAVVSVKLLRRGRADYTVEALSLDLERAWELHDELHARGLGAGEAEFDELFVTRNELDQLDAMVFSRENAVALGRERAAPSRRVD